MRTSQQFETSNLRKLTLPSFSPVYSMSRLHRVPASRSSTTCCSRIVLTKPMDCFKKSTKLQKTIIDYNSITFSASSICTRGTPLSLSQELLPKSMSTIQSNPGSSSSRKLLIPSRSMIQSKSHRRKKLWNTQPT